MSVKSACLDVEMLFNGKKIKGLDLSLVDRYEIAYVLEKIIVLILVSLLELIMRKAIILMKYAKKLKSVLYAKIKAVQL